MPSRTSDISDLGVIRSVRGLVLGCGTLTKKISMPMAIAAVTISTASTPCMGSNSSSKAPRAGEKTLIMPSTAWLIPPNRARCSLGTINVVDAVRAGPWKTPAAERVSKIAMICQIWIAPVAKSTARTTVANATTRSAMIITSLRFQRSTNAPTNGPSRMLGTIAAVVAVASTVAEPVCFVTYHTRANCTNALPRSETICPIPIGR